MSISYSYILQLPLVSSPSLLLRAVRMYSNPNRIPRRGLSGRPAFSSPCCDLPEHRTDKGRSDRRKERRVHSVFMFGREVQESEHARIEERTGRERERSCRALERSHEGSGGTPVYLSMGLVILSGGDKIEVNGLRRVR